MEPACRRAGQGVLSPRPGRLQISRLDLAIWRTFPHFGQSHRILHHLYGTMSESSGLLTMSRNSLRNLGAFCRARRLVGGPLHFDAGSCTFFCPARNRCPPDGCMGSDVEKCEFAAHRGSSCNPATYLAGGIFRSLPSFDGKLFREVGLR